MNLHDRESKIQFLKGLAAGTRQINEIIPLRMVFFRQVSEGVDQYVKVIEDRSEFVKANDGKVYSLEQLEEMQERALKHYRETFIIMMVSDTPLASCEEDIIM